MTTLALSGGDPPRKDLRLPLGWVSIDSETYVMRVPGGMVMRVRADAVDSALVFIPCDASDMRKFLDRHGV